MDFDGDLQLREGTPFERLQARVLDGWNNAQALREKWRTAWDFYRGDGQLPWQTKLPADLQDDAICTNFTFSSIEQYVATLMQDEPDWFVVAEDGDQDDSARTATDYLQAYAAVYNVNAEREGIYRYALVMGTGVAEVYWDPRSNNPAVRAIDPCNVVVDPSASRLEDAEFVAIRHVYGYQLATRLFDKLPSEPHMTSADGIEIVGAEEQIDTSDVDTAESAQTRIVVWEVFHDFGAKRNVYSGNKKLHEGNNPIPNERFPIVLFPMYPMRRRIWADGLITQIEPLQEFFNKLRTRVAIWARYVANPVVVKIGQSRSQVSVNPGDIIEIITPGGDVKYLRPADMPADVFRTLQELPGDMDVITGVHDITRGIRPVGTTSGISLEVLHQAAQTRLTGPARAWTAAWSEVGQRVLELMQKHYSGERSLALLAGGERSRVGIEPAQLSGFAQAVDEDGQPQFSESGEPKQEIRAYRYRVVTQPKGDLPLSPAAMAEMALQLMALPAEDGRPTIDRQALLEATRFPGREQLLQRIVEQGDAQMQGEMDAMAALQGQQQQMMAGDEQAAQAQAAMAQAQSGMEQLTQAAQAILTPEEAELVARVVRGEAPPAALDYIYASKGPREAQLLSLYVEAATRGEVEVAAGV